MPACERQSLRTHRRRTLRVDAPDLIHQRTLGKIHIAFANYLVQNPIGEILLGPGVILSDDDGVIPDLVYVSSKRRNEIATGDRIYGSPTLMIEILSPGSQNRERDGKLKLKLYSKFGVEEYWIADPRPRAIEVYRREGERLKLFTTFISDETISSPLLPDFCPAVKSFF